MSDAEHEVLDELIRSKLTNVRLALPARIVLLAALGLPNKDIALDVRRIQVSRDPEFVETLEDIVGLYMSPPKHALVLCCDEKSQVQALDHTQPGLPMKKGRAGTMTHDYKRNGTTTLFAALNVLDGHVIGVGREEACSWTGQQRHTNVEWLEFLRQLGRETPRGKTLHLVADNCATHKHPVLQEWLAKAPEVQHAIHAHFGLLAEQGRAILP